MKKQIFDDAELAVTLLFRHRNDKRGKGIYLNCMFNLPCNNTKEIPGIVYVKDCRYYVDSNIGVKPDIVNYEITDSHTRFMTPEEGFSRLNIRYLIPDFLADEANKLLQILEYKRELINSVRKEIPNADEKIIRIFLNETKNDVSKAILILKPIQHHLTRLFGKYPRVNKKDIINRFYLISWDVNKVDEVEEYIKTLISNGRY